MKTKTEVKQRLLRLRSKGIKTNKNNIFNVTRFFNPDKSPHTVIRITAEKQPVYSYIAKHLKRAGKVVYDSWKGTPYERKKHGELPGSKRLMK